MNALNTVAAALLGLGLTCGALGDTPSTQPSDGSASSSASADSSANHPPLHHWPAPSKAPYTQQEWDSMMEFMRIYSPYRESILERVPPGRNMGLRMAAIRQWRNFNFTKEHFPKIADYLLQRVKLEDDLLMLTIEAKKEQGPEAIELHDKIRDKVSKIVDIELLEQKARIDRLQQLVDDQTKLLAMEKTRFAKNQESEDETVDNRTRGIWDSLVRGNPSLSEPSTRPDAAPEATSVTAEEQPTTKPSSGSMINISDPVDTEAH